MVRFEFTLWDGVETSGGSGKDPVTYRSTGGMIWSDSVWQVDELSILDVEDV